MSESRKLRILLVNPWITDFAAYDHWSKPLGLLYLASVLKQAGAQVFLLDCLDRHHPLLRQWNRGAVPPDRRYGTGKYLREVIAKPAVFAHVPRHFARYGLPPELVRRALNDIPRPDAVLVTSGMTYWYPGVQMMISLLREQFPGVPVLLGGIYATLLPEHARRHSGADLVVAGEAEARIAAVLNEVLGYGVLPQATYTALDDLPFPAWELYPHLQYAVVLTSRGCPLRCSFCASHLVAGGFRMRRPERVAEELQHLHRVVGVREIAFYDDALLTSYPRQLSRILQQVRRLRLPLQFHTPNGLQCRFLTSEVAHELRASGFRSIRLSLESANEERQRQDMSRKVSRESFVRAAQALRQAGFEPTDVDAYVMMALPGQPLKEVLQSMALVHATGVGIRLAAYSPIPGTVDFRRAQAQGFLPQEMDPLLSNNSCLPVRPAGLGYDTYNRVALLAKNLNEHLRSQGRPVAGETELVSRLANHFSEYELHAVAAASERTEEFSFSSTN